MTTPKWQLKGSAASLQVGKLSAALEARKPASGLSLLKWNGLPVSGHILGVTADTGPLSGEKCGAELFVRGNDLIANFAQVNQQPFSCQIYWRADSQANGVILLDTILSMQTGLLKSFPQLAVETKLAIEEVWRAGGTGDSANPWAKLTEQKSSGEDSCCVVLRPQGADWSYAEMSHPDDFGTWQIKQAPAGLATLRRELGGAFLEKGVIRRMRVRGALLPRKQDLKLASDCFAALAAESPPLTA